MHELALKIALVCAAGIGAQWLAWKMRLPAIVLLLVAGFALGPATGFINPVDDFGHVFEPVISLAVAIILFEGGLTLNFREIRETSQIVRRVILISGPLIWILTAAAAHYIAGLTWSTSAVIGAILVVTGPTVVMPLLRQAQLSPRPASVLRWEAIINDPIGALFAVLAFETLLILHGDHDASHLYFWVPFAAVLAVGGGWALARLIQWLFVHGHVAEFLKVPILLSSILLAYAATNVVLEEAGLLTVTIMGVVLGNSRIASLAEIRRFKETMTTVLVSGVFILLTASLSLEDIETLDWRIFAFIACLLFIIRPLAIWVATIGTAATWQERLFVGWIAPRGIVAVAISGLFGSTLVGIGVSDANHMVIITFAVVVSTILLHGFSFSTLAGILGLKSTARPGILMVGGSPWTTSLAEKLSELNVPVMITDRNWNRISEARLANIPVYFGEVLSAEAHHAISFSNYSSLVAATDNDAYNTLICTDLGPELGRGNVYQVSPEENRSERHTMNFTLGGRRLSEEEADFRELGRRHRDGWEFHATTLSADFTYDLYLENRQQGSMLLLWIGKSGKVTFATTANAPPGPDDCLVSYAPPTKPRTQGQLSGNNP